MSTDSQSATQTATIAGATSTDPVRGPIGSAFAGPSAAARDGNVMPKQHITGKRVLLNWILFFAGYAAIMAVSYWLFR